MNVENYPMDPIVFIFLLAFICGIIGCFIDGVRGGVFGFLLGPIGLIIAAILSLRSNKDIHRVEESQPQPTQYHSVQPKPYIPSGPKIEKVYDKFTGIYTTYIDGITEEEHNKREIEKTEAAMETARRIRAAQESYDNERRKEVEELRLQSIKRSQEMARLNELDRLDKLRRKAEFRGKFVKAYVSFRRYMRNDWGFPYNEE